MTVAGGAVVGGTHEVRRGREVIAVHDQKRRREDECHIVMRAPINFDHFQEDCDVEYVPMRMFMQLVMEHKKLKHDMTVMQDFLSKATQPHESRR